MTRPALADIAWMNRAACSNDPDGDWFPMVKHLDEPRAVHAFKVCARCPVQNACLRYASITRQGYGIWGGVYRDAENRQHQVAS